MSQRSSGFSDERVIDELDGELREAVEAIRLRTPDEVSIERSLARVVAAGSNARKGKRTTPVRRRLIAATILCAVFGTSWWILKPESSWAQVTEALRLRPWIHARVSGDGEREIWLSPVLQVAASRSEQRISYDDFKLGVGYEYKPQENKLFRFKHGSDYTKREMHVFESMFLGILRNDAELDSPLVDGRMLEQQRREVVDGGKTWTEYDLTLRRTVNDETVRLLVRVDSVTNLPHSMTIAPTPKPDEKQRNIRFAFDYPDAGPTDVYAAGVPRTATYVDRVPSDDLAMVLRGVQANRERFETNYHVIAVPTVGSNPPWQGFKNVIRLWRRGRQWRLESGGPTAKWKMPERPAPETDMVDWWERRIARGVFQFTPIAVCDGTAVYTVDYGKPDAKGRQTLSWRRICSVGPSQNNTYSRGQAGQYMPEYAAYPVFIGEPNSRMTVDLNADPSDGPAGSILITNKFSNPGAYATTRIHVDPQRRYVALRTEHDDLQLSEEEKQADPPPMLREVSVNERFVQSPRGLWYPTVVRRKNCVGDINSDGVREHDSLTWFYVDFNADLPAELFRPIDRAADDGSPE